MSRSIVGAFVGVLLLALLISPGGAVSGRTATVARPASAYAYDSPSAATTPVARQRAVALIGKRSRRTVPGSSSSSGCCVDAGAFPGLPKGLAKQVGKDPGVARAITTGRRYLGLE
jgi:hypothetical protein